MILENSMNRLKIITEIREKLRNGKASIGSWMQIPHGSVAEILGHAGYDWVAVDLEHGSISTHQLPDLFRALESYGTLPLVRVSETHPKDCKKSLDAGAGGVILPVVESSNQLKAIIENCAWPPTGKRGVGFSRANLFGKHFDDYRDEAQSPIVVAQIENIRAVEALENILMVPGLDAILIGPYDLSASMGLTGKFENQKFKSIIHKIKNLCKKYKVPCGIHVIDPNYKILKKRQPYWINSIYISNTCCTERLF